MAWERRGLSRHGAREPWAIPTQVILAIIRFIQSFSSRKDRTPTSKSQLEGVFSLRADLLKQISRLEHIHSRNFIHRDIKPDNILTGIGNEQDTIFLIDFSIAQRYRNPSSRIHIPMQENLPLVGTPAFTSVNSHLGLQLSRRDDIESLTFTLVFLYYGSLPWLTPDGKSPPLPIISDRKQQFLADQDTSARDTPIELAIILRHARSLTFTQKPEYGYLCTALENAVDTKQPSSLSSLLVSDSPSVILTPAVSTVTPTSQPITFTPGRKKTTKLKAPRIV